MSAIIRLNNKTLLQNYIGHIVKNSSRCISTSQKNRETAAISDVDGKVKTETATAAGAKKKNWVSYGFSTKDEAEDRNAMKATFFFSVTLCLVWGTFIWAYLPDTQKRDWAQREGYLELRRRELAGVDLVNPNYVDPAKIELPSDEELGDTEIII